MSVSLPTAACGALWTFGQICTALFVKRGSTWENAGWLVETAHVTGFFVESDLKHQ
jgi:hypothetical protein